MAATQIDPKHKRLADFYLQSPERRARRARGRLFQAARQSHGLRDPVSRRSPGLHRRAKRQQLEQLNRARAFRIYEELAVCGHSDIRDYVIGKNGNVKLAPACPKMPGAPSLDRSQTDRRQEGHEAPAAPEG
jgi:hypothetical protein